MTRRLPPPLVALSPGTLAPEDRPRFLEALRRAVAAGLRSLVLREQVLLDGAFLELARACREILAGDGWLSVHDRVHLAGATRADAVHLGFRSLAPAIVRGIVGAEIAIGLSAHAGDDVVAWRAADYLVFGPVLATPSKRGILEPAGFDALALAAVAARPVPVWAIGGIGPRDVRACLDAGCRGVAVLSGILSAPDPAAACRAYLDAGSGPPRAGPG
jgi:thiamine-phosphate pyrophosphorylase